MKIEDRISASILRLRMRHPFFATLALHARLIADETLPTACTDGLDILYNPVWLEALSPSQLDATILHEVLHAALIHVTRRGQRDPIRWNIAADIVVNGVVSAENLTLPDGAIREPSLEHLSVEAIYELLDAHTPHLCPHCMRPASPDDDAPDAVRRAATFEAHWRDALRNAQAVSRMSGQGNLPAGLARRVEAAAQPQLDWRRVLWRFVVRTPNDYTGFDRRFLSRGLYLDALDGEALSLFVCIDTSGSIASAQLSVFLGELLGILRAYPHIDATFYYADAALSPPHTITLDHPLPPPTGGGGTDFRPFFAAVAKQPARERVCVYLTDGYGTFPDTPPADPVLWVVTPRSKPADSFPFGEVVTLLKDT